MKIIRFSSRKKPLFAFEAEAVRYEQEAGEGVLLLHAQGHVRMQEDIAIQEMFAGDYPGLLEVLEGEEKILQARCTMTFLQLEEGSFTARIVIEK